GYVVEAPIWKTSYRLVMDGENKGKPYLQGWAMVENPTDEDWAGVKMALVSGRPISFKMDLYNPLYVSRPTVEPELFASLRPPTYGWAMNKRDEMAAYPPAPTGGGAAGGFGAGGGRGFGPGGPAPKAAKGDAARLRGGEAPTEEQRRFAGLVGERLQGRIDLGASVQSVAPASSPGDYYQDE